MAHWISENLHIFAVPGRQQKQGIYKGLGELLYLAENEGTGGGSYVHLVGSHFFLPEMEE